MRKMIIFLSILLLFFGSISNAQTLVTPGSGKLYAAIEAAQSGDILQLTGGGVYTEDSTNIALVNKSIIIRVDPNSTEKAIVKLGDSAPSGSYYFFMMMNGGSLYVKGIDFDGSQNGAPTAKSFIRYDGGETPATAHAGTIKIEDCEIHDFSDNIIHGYAKSSMLGMIQDSIIIHNTVMHRGKAFIRLKYVGLNYMSITNSTFYDCDSYGIYFGNSADRGSSITPEVVIDKTTWDKLAPFVEVYEMEKPWTVTNSIFSNISKANTVGLKWADNKTDPIVTISNTCIWNYGNKLSTTEPYWPGYSFKDTLGIDPNYKDAANGDFTLSAGSALLTAGTDGKAIGDPRWTSNEPSAISLEDDNIPSEFKLFQNYPNPFNPTTNIRFNIINEGMVTLKVYDLLGREVCSLVNQHLNPGSYNVDFNASDLSSGIYIYRLNSARHSLTMKMLLMK